jgi:hypothetical protein
MDSLNVGGSVLFRADQIFSSLLRAAAFEHDVLKEPLQNIL